MTIAASRNQPLSGSWSVNFSAVVPVKHWRAANAGMELPLRAESAPTGVASRRPVSAR